MIAAIMQPTYLPWIGYFDLVDTADIFVFLDDAQVLKRSWGVRNRILTQNGETYLTVPLSGHKHGEGSPFSRTLIDVTQKWPRSHLSTIRHAYSKAPHFKEVFPVLEALLEEKHKTIGAMNMAFIRSTAERMGIRTPFLQSSQLDIENASKDKWLLAICRKVEAGTYLSARGSAAYIEQDQEGGAFADSGVSLVYHHYEHPEYPQQGENFTRYMSVIDLLMNCGYEEALKIIWSGRRDPLSSAAVRKDLG